MGYTLKRKLYNVLSQWKRTAAGQKALLIEGAPGIGKTTIVTEFGRNAYRTYLLLDFSHIDSKLAMCFEEPLQDLDTFFSKVSEYTGAELYKRETLIIFDEVNRFPPARKILTRLVLDGRYDYIATCSFNPIRGGQKVYRLPEKVHSISLEPLDFEEFLWALGERKLADCIRKSFKSGKRLIYKQHDKANRLQREYMLVGGMPQVVANYTERRTLASAETAKRAILEKYRYFIAEFANYKPEIASSLFDLAPRDSQNGCKPFVYYIGSHVHPPELRPIFDWLEASFLVHRCIRHKGLLAIDDKKEYADVFRYYFSDTGLLSTLAIRDGSASEDLYCGVDGGRLWVSRGRLTENYVAQCLHSSGHRLDYWISNENQGHICYEVDFLLPGSAKKGRWRQPILIEVKSGKDYTTKSLDYFEEYLEEKGRLGASILLTPKPCEMLSEQKRITSGGARIRRMRMPLYMAGLI